MPLSTRAVEDACLELSSIAERTRAIGPWQSGAFERLARHGLLAAFIPGDCGGSEATEAEILAMLVEVARACLTTALPLTQWASGCRLIASASHEIRRRYLPALARGETHTTVGISHLTTSRRHLSAPLLEASSGSDGWRLSGSCPWVTGADASDTIVTGASVASSDGGPMVTRFFIVPRTAEGVFVEPPMPLMGLSGSRTSAVRFERAVAVDSIEPEEGRAARSGGLATTALAVGAARRSIDLLGSLAGEGAGRPEIRAVVHGLETESEAIFARLLDLAGRQPSCGGSVERDTIRAEATSLAIRAAQASLLAAKGAGYVAGHPAEVAIRESMFFLVWSCPQTVASAVMCELAGLAP